MNGMQQGIMDAGRELGRMGGHLLGAGGHGLDAMEIVWLVLGSVLWAALMTTLVMGMIALVRYLKKPKDDTSPKEKSE